MIDLIKRLREAPGDEYLHGDVADCLSGILEAKEELQRLLVQASEDANESNRIAPNSCGAGWDEGFRFGLKRALDLFEGNE